MTNTTHPTLTRRLSILPLGISLLTVLTALLHLLLVFNLVELISSGTAPAGMSLQGLWFFAVLFTLNCLGYLALLVALYFKPLHRFQRITRWLLIGYTALTILLWAIMAGSNVNALAYIDKAIEAALIVLLVLEDRQFSSRQSALPVSEVA